MGCPAPALVGRARVSGSNITRPFGDVPGFAASRSSLGRRRRNPIGSIYRWLGRRSCPSRDGKRQRVTVIGARLPRPLEGSGIEFSAGIAMNRRNRDRTGLAEVSPTRRARNFALSKACMTQLGRVQVLLRETGV